MEITSVSVNSDDSKETMSFLDSTKSSKYNEYSDLERKVVKRCFVKHSKRFAALFENEKAVFRKALRATREAFKDRYSSTLIKTWIRKETPQDRRKNNKGKPHKYHVINQDVILALPKYVLTHQGNF